MPTSTAPRRYRPPAETDGLSLLRQGLLVLLGLVMPTLLGAWLLEPSARLGLLLLLLPAGVIAVLLLPNLGASMQNSAHRLFYLYFAVVGAFTMLNGFRFGLSVAREDLIALATLVIWASPFISVYYLINSPQTYRWAVRIIDFAGLGIALSVVLGFLGPRYLGIQFGEYNSDGTEVRAFGPFGDQVGFPLVYFVVRSVFRGKLVLFALYCSAILLTGTRGAVLSLGVGLSVAVLFGASISRGVQGTSVKFILVILWTVVFTVGFLFSDFGATTRTRLQALSRGESSLQQRFGSMGLGLQVLADNPIGGVGYLGFKRMGAEYGFHQRFAGDAKGNSTYTAQNQYLQSALDGGIFALVTWIAFLWSVYRVLKKALLWVDPVRQMDLRAGIAWLVALVIGNQAAVWFLSHNITTYLFVVVFAVLLRGASFPLPVAPRTPVRRAATNGASGI